MAVSHTEPQQTETARERITDVAADRFLRRGYAQTSLRDIASEVGIKAGSIYYHFDSKEDLLLDVLRQGIGVMEEAFTLAADETAGADAGTRVAAHIRAHLSALFEHGPYTANHVSAFHTAPEAVKEAVIPDRDRYEASWAELLTELRDDGALTDDLDLTLARLALFGAMNFAIEWFDPERGNLDELADVICRQFWQGVEAR